MLTTEVYKLRLQEAVNLIVDCRVIGQVPLIRNKAPPSSLGFKHVFVVPGCKVLRHEIAGYLIPVYYRAIMESGA